MCLSQRFRSARGSLAALAVNGLLLSACTGSVDDQAASGGAASNGAASSGPAAGGSTAPGSGGAGNNSTGAGPAASGGTSTGTDCVGTNVTTPKRLVRLTENQIVQSYAALFGAAQAATLTKDEELPAQDLRAFPPLQGATFINDSLYSFSDRMAQGAMKYIGANLSMAGCGAAPTDMCGQQYLNSFAEKAYRRPLTEGERTAISNELWKATTTDGASVAEAIQFGIYGILSSSGFLYRTEFGEDAHADGALTASELANELAFFITDGPPDDALLAAVKSGQFTASNADQVRAQVDRLLLTPAARANLETALIAYFQLPSTTTVALDPETVPGLTVTAGLRNSMYHEGELFMKNTLWSGPMAGLITSRRTWVNSQIAMPIYGVAPPTELDADMFGPVDLPADRTGLLTLSPFLTSKSRPDKTSVVARGLALNAALICQQNPPFPEGNAAVEEAIDNTAELTQKQQADYRAGNALCLGCHKQFDAFGLVLEPYDSIGRYRTADLQGRPIDAATTMATLPPAVGSTKVANAVEVAQALVATGALNSCMAMNFMNFALADVSQGGANVPPPSSAPPTGGCAVKEVVGRFNATDRSFSSLIREVSASATLALRSRGM